ncbi:hypothetical protein GCM10023165_07500 [Variovorax defluvii]|uniref:Uncharacterized protein n=1 Tax=Variovorax defluvii TaxID=913761 RepID=A0ABP8H0Y2_9BURK
MTDETSTWLKYASLQLAADSLCLFNDLPATSDQVAEHVGPPDPDTSQSMINKARMHDSPALLDALVKGELHGIGMFYCTSVANKIPGHHLAANDEAIGSGPCI